MSARVKAWLRLWWRERAVDRPFDAEASDRLDAAVVAWECAR
jgi:hypothetical protein